MAREKVKFKWKPDELRVVHDFVALMISNLRTDREDDWSKLLICELSGILKKLAPVLVFPKRENSLSLKLQEALAFKLAGEDYDLSDFDDYTANVLLQVFHRIDQDTT